VSCGPFRPVDQVSSPTLRIVLSKLKRICVYAPVATTATTRTTLTTRTTPTTESGPTPSLPPGSHGPLFTSSFIKQR